MNNELVYDFNSSCVFFWLRESAACIICSTRLEAKTYPGQYAFHFRTATHGHNSHSSPHKQICFQWKITNTLTTQPQTRSHQFPKQGSWQKWRWFNETEIRKSRLALRDVGPLEWESWSARTDELFSSTTMTSYSPSSWEHKDLCWAGNDEIKINILSEK